MDFTFAQCTDPGKIRKQNEDFMGNAVNDHLEARLFCVADGMGGYGAGDVASKMVVNCLLRNFSDLKRLSADSLKSIVNDFFDSAQQELMQYRKNNNNAMMGTTLAMILFYQKLAVSANIGDSRIYCFDGQQLTQKSRDHTLVNDLINNNSISPEQARTHPQKHVLSRALTGESQHADPHVNIDSFLNNNIYLICTDGLYNMMDEKFISSKLKESSIFEAKEQLLTQAYAKGAKDNITFQIIKPEDDEPTLTCPIKA